MIAGPPRTPVQLPRAVARLAGRVQVRPVWQNELGGLTFQMGTGTSAVFVKWAPTGSGLDLAAEAARMAWAGAFTPVPRVLEQGADDSGSWLMTSGLPGESAVSERWSRSPEVAVTAIGRGLRALHDALPVDGCPFSWSLADRIEDARRRAAAGLIDRARWHPVHRPLGIKTAIELAADPPPVDVLVVCHADACAPNTIVSANGACCGHVDLGRLGVADRWADLAIATWSTEWNYGTGWEAPLLEAYGIEPDHQRTRYYRLLWDLGP